MDSRCRHPTYIWQRSDWPNFTWRAERIVGPLAALSHKHGLLTGKMESLGFDKQGSATLTALSDELTASSAIEGIQLQADSVRSSIARRLGLDAGGLLVEDHYVEGLVEVMLDAVRNASAPLTEERLFGWHAALFPTGRSGMHPITVGGWRMGEEPMQVVSGAFGHEKVHYQAPASAKVPCEMKRFLDWCAATDLPPFLAAAVAHLWLVSIHPFDDGNGRVSRTVSDMFLSRMETGTQRYYSMSAAINRNKKAYYAILEKTQHGGLDITDWILWFLQTLEEAIGCAIATLRGALAKKEFWDHFRHYEINERQRKVLNRLWDGFNGKLTTSKWAKICHCSQDTALRDIQSLLSKGMLVESAEGGRSKNYLLPELPQL